jgi:hypothetical protein
MAKKVFMMLMLGLISIYSGPVRADLNDGLVAYYPFDGNANDQSGKGNDGVLQGNVNFASDRTGRQNSAANFDGVSAVIEVKDSPSLDSIEAQNAVTVASWINIRNWYQGWNVFNVINKYNPQNDWGWEFAAFAKWVRSLGGLEVGCSWSALFNRWYHVAIAYDKSTGTASFYVDGALLCSQAQTAGIAASNGGPLYIGYSPIGPDEFSNGLIDDLRIYNRALSGEEIGDLFRGNQAPVANAGPGQRVEMTSCSGANVILDGSGSYDPDGDTLTYTWTWAGGSATGVSPTVTLPYGTTTVSLAVDDGRGGTATAGVVVNVVDTTPPVLAAAVSPNVLWPPDHRYVKIASSINVTDACVNSVAIERVSATSNEPDNGLGDGDSANDIAIQSDGTLLLRAERSGAGSGRIYTITYQATDIGGNSATASTDVVVPHDRQKK